MYKGIKRKNKVKHDNYRRPNKCQIVTLEEVETNGIIRQNYVVKTEHFQADPNIKYTDFEVANLKAVGIDVEHMAETYMTPSTEKLASSAETANNVLDSYEIIKELETTKPKQNETQTHDTTE